MSIIYIDCHIALYFKKETSIKKTESLAGSRGFEPNGIRAKRINGFNVNVDDQRHQQMMLPTKVSSHTFAIDCDIFSLPTILCKALTKSVARCIILFLSTTFASMTIISIDNLTIQMDGWLEYILT